MKCFAFSFSKGSGLWIMVLCFGILLCPDVWGKTRIYGIAKYNGLRPIANATIVLEGTYDGTTTGIDGKFSFETDEVGAMTITAKSDEFVPISQSIQVKNGIDIEIKLSFTTKSLVMSGVTVRPRVFESSDKYKATVLNHIDIVTTSTDANIAGALKTMPGTQQVGESGDLFVRGGAGYETKTFIDGLWVSNFNYSSPANIAARSRFPPNMFKGTFFSSGGYSALYGQALSSTLVLESEDLPAKSSADISISPIWAGAGIQKLSKNQQSAVGGIVNYTNLGPILSFLKTNIEFTQKPSYFDGSFYWRKKVKNNGYLKFFASAGSSNVGLEKNDIDFQDVRDNIGLKNQNLYTNFTFKQNWAAGWKFYIGSSYSLNIDKFSVKAIRSEKQTVFDSTSNNTFSIFQLRTVLTKNVFQNSKLHIGSEFRRQDDRLQGKNITILTPENYAALFSEMDTYLTENISARIGVRYEYSSIIGKGNIAPRISVGYTFENNGLLSASYGKFYQSPERNYLRIRQNWNYTEAEHWIVGYQKSDNYRTFRTEIFQKSYQNLVKTSPDLNNNGEGYARGLEVFWRDKKTLKEVDYWVSYSYLDAKRNYADYLTLAQPTFAATHTFSLVAKKYFQKISTVVGTSYTFASGRPYYNPNRPVSEFLTDRTIPYHNLGLTVAYLPKIPKTFSVLALTVSNVLGNDQVFGYNYSTKDFSRFEAIRPVNNPFIFLGLFINFGVDRTDEIINSKL
jgi:vitamin B12 transporter